jgi:ParB family chromosome partitioning protein
MSKPVRRLGRGLDSLVSDLRGEAMAPPAPAAVPTTSDNQRHQAAPQTLPIRNIQPNPFQPRQDVTSADIVTLADSIREHGILQPITVRPHGGGYQIIAGERRWQAAQAAGLAEVPVVVRDATDQQMIEWALIENIQREDLNAIDRALAYRRYCDEFHLKADQVAERLGEDRTTVVNYLRLLDLPGELRQAVADESLSMGHARCLLGVADPDRQAKLADSAIAHGLSVRALEELVRREKTRKADETARGDVVVKASPHVRDMERRFEQAVKTKVSIRESRRRGRGRIVIDYYSFDDFDRIAGQLGVELE